jgi:protocatechuate 3,4-dioxygenase beta subunit
MNRLLIVAILALLQKPTPEASLTSAVDGVVRHSGTAEFVSNVVVSLTPQVGSPLTSTTDDKGRFAFKNVAAGTYRLQAQRDGYIRASKGSGPQTLTVVSGRDIHDVGLSLIATASMSGRIVDNAGQPLKGIQVNAVIVGYNNGREIPVTAIGTDPRPLTNDRGEYRLSGFSPGDYFIKAETPPSVGSLATQHMVSFYPGTISASAAIPVTVREGVDLNGLDFKLQGPDLRQLHTISGKVIQPADTVGSGIVGNFYLFPRDREAGADGNGFTILSTNRADSMSNGNFVLRDVPPGRYDVIAALSTTSTQRAVSHVEVVVGDKDVDNITIPLSRKFEVKGRVVVDSSIAPLPLEPLRISLVANFLLQTYSATVDASGTFDIPDVAEGKYTVSVAAGLPASAYVADIRQNSKSIFGGITSPDDAVIDVNSQSSSVEVVLNAVGGAVNVTVQDARSRIVPEATVALIPDASRRQALMWFKTGTSDDRGQITLTGVAPGNYKVFAWERTPLRAFQSAEFIREYETQGKFVTVDSGGRVAATVSVIPEDSNRTSRTFKTGLVLAPAPADAPLSAAVPVTSNPNNATIEGRVTRLKTGDPIPGIPVYVGDQVARSGPDGHYIINNVPPGTYSLSMRNAQTQGFFPPSRGGVPGSVTVKAKQHIDNLDFKLNAGGKVSGRVLDGNGQPVRNALMRMEAPDYQYSQHHLIPLTIISRTDDRGEYRISGIEPGEYYLGARPTPDGPLAITYYPSTLELGKARVVVVREDDDIVGMDITAQPSAGYKVSGIVSTPSGLSAPESISFYMNPRDGAVADILDVLVHPTRNPATGEFEIANVLPGSYDLIAFAPVGRNAGQPFSVPDAVYVSRTRVDVGTQDVQGVTLALAPTVDVPGRITIEGDDKTISVNSIRVYPVAEDFSPAAVWLISPLRVDASGQFIMPKALPLRYSFSAENVIEDVYISDIREGPTSIFDTGLRVGNTTPDPIEIVINPKGGSVEGVVLDANQKGVPYAAAVLVPQVSRRGVASFYKSVVTDSSGHYSIHGIAPGDYKIFAFESAPSRAWRNAEFIAPFEELGTPVHVDATAHLESAPVQWIPKSAADSR